MNNTLPRVISIVDLLWAYKFRLFLSIYIIFLITYTLLLGLGLAPEEFEQVQGVTVTSKIEDKKFNLNTVTPPVVKPTQGNNSMGAQNANIKENPIKIRIDAINISSVITNPQTTKISILDEYLKKGVIRYPGSGVPGSGNMLLLGHSTSMRLVNNQAYKVFSRIHELSEGDIIQIYTNTKTYRYKVNRVYLVNIDKDKPYIEYSKDNMLTLITCNTLGEREERHVVEANLV